MKKVDRPAANPASIERMRERLRMRKNGGKRNDAEIYIWEEGHDERKLLIYSSAMEVPYSLHTRRNSRGGRSSLQKSNNTNPQRANEKR
jgi:hypothetical protein